MATAALRLTGNIAFNRGNGTVVQMEQVGFPAHVITSGRLDSARLPANPQIIGNLTPVANLTYDLGSAQYRWKDLWLSGAVTGGDLNASELASGIVPAARFGANVAIGEFAGATSQGSSAVAVGYLAGANVQAEQAVAIGYLAGSNTQGASATAIGQRAGETSQNVNATAIGSAAGQTNQGSQATAVGRLAGASNQGVNATAVGVQAGSNTQSSGATAVGVNAGAVSQGLRATAVGINAGISNQGSQATALGDSAGSNLQGNLAVAVGVNAGRSNQGIEAVAVGPNAGHYGQGAASVAIGSCAGISNQDDFATAVGYFAGESNQRSGATALGYTAGRINQGNFATALGGFAGCNAQANLAIAIGWVAGRSAQGSHAIAIGYAAGNTNQASNSIVINASGTTLNNTTANSCVIKPVRDVASVARNVLLYNASAGEISIDSDNFVVNASNRVGIGTTSPSRKLDIYSNDLTSAGYYMLQLASPNTDGAVISLINQASGGRTYFVGSTATGSGAGVGFSIYDSTASVLRMLIGATGTVRLAAYTTNGTLTTTSSNGTLAVSSDARLKSNVVPLGDGALDIVDRLIPSNFEFDAEQGTVRAGFIAQDVETAIPEAVDGKKYEFEFVRDAEGNVVIGEDGGPVLDPDIPRYRGLDAFAISAYSVKAIQELHARIQSLEAENISLKTQNASFEARLAALEASV